MKIIFLNIDQGHYLELVQYFYPPSAEGHIERKNLGATHLAFYVEGMDTFYREKSQQGLTFVNPPADMYENEKLSRKVVYAHDPDGNSLEFIELVG